MTTPAPAPWQVSNDAPAAGALVEAIEGLLEKATPIVWGDVLATALALKAILLRNPDAEPVCTHIDVNVICKCYVELGSPDKAATVLEEALFRRPTLPSAARHCPGETQGQATTADVQQELAMRRLLHRCYQQCLRQTSAASSNFEHNCSERQQQQHSAAILNCQHILQLATLSQDIEQQATSSADLAELYAESGNAAAASTHYAQCLGFCSTAAASAAETSQQDSTNVGSSWIQELLLRTVAAAVDANLSQGSTAAAGSCISTYLAIQQHRGRSACNECAVCYETMTGQTPVLLMNCGHMFHRNCCNEWFGTKMYECGRFVAECPICRQVDVSLQPSQAALDALQEIQQHCAHDSGSSSYSSSSSGNDSDTESGSEVHSPAGSAQQ